MAINNDWLINLVGSLDPTKTKDQINKDIENIQNQLNDVELKAKLENNVVSDLEEQLNNLQISLTDITIPQSTLDGLVSQINNALKGIQIPNININPNVGSGSNGRNVGQVIADDTKEKLEKVMSDEIGVNFRVSADESKEVKQELTNLVKEWTNGKGNVISVSIDTQTSFDSDNDARFEHLKQATVKYANEVGETITKTLRNLPVENVYDDQTGEVMGVINRWVEASATYKKTIESTSKTTNNFVNQQKNAVADLTNTLNQVYKNGTDKNASKPIKDTSHLSNLKTKYDEIEKAIANMGSASVSTFTDERNNVKTLISELKVMVSEYRNAETAATSMRSKDIATIKIDETNNLDAFVQKMEQSGHYTDDLKQKVTILRGQLNSVFDTDSLTKYLNGLSNLQSEFKKVDATAKTAEKNIKLQTNVEAEKKILTLYKNELKEAGVLTGDVKQKIQDMFHSLSKVDSQNGLTTWRAELKGVKAETDAVLKSVQSSSVKEQDAYEVAYKELKKLYDLKIEYAKLGSNKETDFYYGKAIADQEKVWRQAWSKTSEPDNWNVQKRNELHREELVLQDKLAQAYGKTANARKQAEDVNKIQHSLDVGDYDAQIETIKKGFISLSGDANEAETHVKGLRDALQSMHDATDDNGRLNAEKSYRLELEKTDNQLTIAKAKAKEYVDVLKVQKLKNDIQDWLRKNTAATNEAKTAMTAYLNTLDDVGHVSQSSFNEAKQALDNWDTKMRVAGKLGKSFSETFKEGVKSFTSWAISSGSVMEVWNGLKNGLRTIKDLDTVLVDLRKTTDATAQELEDFYYSSNETAKQLGVTTSEVINATSAWSRLGYAIEDATTLAKNSAILASISPEMDIDTATDGLVSTLKAFKIEAEDSLDGVISKINIIGNTQAVDNNDVVDILTRSSSAMAEANNTLEETIALGVAATEITRDADAVGTMLKTVSMRIRGRQTLPPYTVMYMLCA